MMELPEIIPASVVEEKNNNYNNNGNDDDDDDDDVVVQEIDVFLSSISVPHHHGIDAHHHHNYHYSGSDSNGRYNNHPPRTYLMQYPGHWNLSQQHRQHHLDESSSSLSSTIIPTIVSVRIKPRHNILEAEHVVHNEDDTTTTGTGTYGDGRNRNDTTGSPWQYTHHNNNNNAIATSTRTYESQTIPMNTHLCLGKYVSASTTTPSPSSSQNNITELHLIPITNVTQMRPSFQHLTNPSWMMNSEEMEDDELRLEKDVDEVEDMMDDNHNPSKDLNTTTTTTTTTTSITYQRKESDRAMAARKSSYAYQIQSQDQEAFVSLQIITNMSGGRRGATLSTIVTNRRICMFRPSVSTTGSNEYIQSLNYLANPPLLLNTSNNQYGDDRILEDLTPCTATNIIIQNEQKRILSRILTILQWNNGPVPFSILVMSITENHHHHPLTTVGTNTAHNTRTHDDMSMTVSSSPPEVLLLLLLSILNTVGVLVRGNWYIHSKFMKILPHPSIVRTNQQQKQQQQSVSVSSVSSSVIIVGSNTNHQQLVYKRLQQRIRTFALLLLHLYGKIYRTQFIRAYHHGTTTTTSTTTVDDNNNDDDSWTSPPEDDSTHSKLFTMILHQMAKPTKYGYWVGKIQDDVSFLESYRNNTILVQHQQYWNEQQSRRFQKELLYYNNNNNTNHPEFRQ
jgi:hypothetical protein